MFPKCDSLVRCSTLVSEMEKEKVMSSTILTPRWAVAATLLLGWFLYAGATDGLEPATAADLAARGGQTCDQWEIDLDHCSSSKDTCIGTTYYNYDDSATCTSGSCGPSYWVDKDEHNCLLTYTCTENCTNWPACTFNGDGGSLFDIQRCQIRSELGSGGFCAE